jgi:outer membrane murein-binding lipoprotein Lpp
MTHKDMMSSITKELVVAVILAGAMGLISWGAQSQRLDDIEANSTKMNAKQEQSISDMKIKQDQLVRTTVRTETKVENIEEDVKEIRRLLTSEYGDHHDPSN